ncbi:MAG: c-type cytochrome [Chloroflexi bacterium]|nr:c-type cytochrome [Chloroflexota bacterium]
MPHLKCKWLCAAGLALSMAGAALAGCQGAPAGPAPTATATPPARTASPSPPPVLTQAATPKATVAVAPAITPAPARTAERTPSPPPPVTRTPEPAATPKPVITSAPQGTTPPTPAATPKPAASPKPAATSTPAAPPPSTSGADPQRGKTVFTNLGCPACHGAEAQGGFGPPLMGKAAPLLKDVIRHGSEPGMPAFDAGKLSDADLDNIVAFLSTSQAAAPPQTITKPAATPKPAATATPAAAPPVAGGADPQRGKTVYTNLGCGGCHGPEAQGGFGPSLIGKAAPLLKDVIRHGSEPGMPAFDAGKLSDADLDNMVAFLATLK